MLSLQSVHKSFGKHAAVSDLSLEAGRGEIVALLGPSGCGKTTTLRMVAGFDRPDAGRILFDGKVIDALRPYERNIGVVFQDYALFPHKSVIDNVMFGPRERGVSRKEARERADRYLRLTRMTEFADRMPDMLSGGQRQRVALARALAIEPDVLLLDEPLSALDAKLRITLRAEMREILLAVNCVTLLVTHDQEEAMTLSDRVCVMNGGRIEQAGTPEEIYNRPVTEFVGVFVGRANVLEGTLEKAGENVLFRVAGRTVLILPTSCASATEGPAKLLIRPEALSNTPAARESIVLDGVLVYDMFLGPSREIGFKFADGLDMTALLRGGRVSALPHGAPIKLFLRPEDIIWIR
ncbi:ABC transporter ATP-binding protein [Bradyrhizobium sp. 166]|uniref:ABC transporter ATP-binding protein n=1 Tax=Bradyrhizobium sp. 166 TaxID=2782638 RepID=UPI001FF973E0|nr:ABC transporter ATP-binding protein [Bradyrhizobium sp. 166]